MGFLSKILKKKKDGKGGGGFTNVDQNPKRKENPFSAGGAQKKISERNRAQKERIDEIFR